jgi:hypothetical protein
MPVRTALRSAGDRSRSTPTNAISFAGFLTLLESINIAHSLNAACAEKLMSTRPAVISSKRKFDPLLSPLSSASDDGHVYLLADQHWRFEGASGTACFALS